MVFVHGPGSVLDRFVAYANELKADAYWPRKSIRVTRGKVDRGKVDTRK
jgi:hypothetical protein